MDSTKNWSVKDARGNPMSYLFCGAVQAGVPAGALNVLPGFGETAGASITSHMDVDKVLGYRT